MAIKTHNSVENEPRRRAVLDIETAPILGYSYEQFDTNLFGIVRDSYMLSFAWRWLDEKKTHVWALPDFKRYKRDPHNDYELILKLRELLDEADIVITQNGDAFDLKYFNGRAIIHGIQQPSPYDSVDTFKESKRIARYGSHSLEARSRARGRGGKLTHSSDLQLLCVAGNKGAWRTLKAYNIRDVDLTLAWYYDLLPWIIYHPPLYAGKNVCSVCGLGGISRGSKILKSGRERRWYFCPRDKKWIAGELIEL